MKKTVIRDPKSLERVTQVCGQVDDYLLICHIDPDGDALGSLLAFGLALRGAGKNVQLACPDTVPLAYRFLPHWEEIVVDREELTHLPEVVITVDSADRERLGHWEPVLKEARVVVNIDHHYTNSRYGQINWIEDVGATAELIFILLEELGWVLTPDIALALYTAVVTDTGSFRYANTTDNSHRQAAKLLQAGAEPALVTEHLYESRSVGSVRLLARTLQSLQFSCDKRLAWLTIGPEDLAVSGASKQDVNGLVNYARAIAGVEVGLLFHQIAENLVKVALRSKGLVDVSEVASQFAGGGHPRAAGCRIAGPLEQVVDQVVRAVEQVLCSKGGD